VNCDAPIVAAAVVRAGFWLLTEAEGLDLARALPAEGDAAAAGHRVAAVGPGDQVLAARALLCPHLRCPTLQFHVTVGPSGGSPSRCLRLTRPDVPLLLAAQAEAPVTFWAIELLRLLLLLLLVLVVVVDEEYKVAATAWAVPAIFVPLEADPHREVLVLLVEPRRVRQVLEAALHIVWPQRHLAAYIWTPQLVFGYLPRVDVVFDKIPGAGSAKGVGAGERVPATNMQHGELRQRQQRPQLFLLEAP